MEKIKCRCGSEDYRTEPVKFKNGTDHLKAVCNACDKYIKFIPLSEELPTHLSFGKYKGKRIDEVETNYLIYLQDNSGGRYKIAVDIEVQKRLNNILSN
jgi:hypothetical protein